MKPISRTHKNYKTILSYLRLKYPVGVYIYDPCRSGRFKIKKSSIFEMFEFEYNEESLPADLNRRDFEFTVRDPGKYAERWGISGSMNLYWINLYLKKHDNRKTI